ncbi:cell adhesion molecule DSCAM-like isoform X2 [Dysidea avara]
MGDEISSVQRLIRSFIRTERTNALAYILTTFNDPDVGVPMKYLSNDIDQLIALELAVNNITAHGGGDCPEYGMTGIINALSLSDSDSNVIVLTDAGAKDAYRQGEVITRANELRVSVHFFLSGSGCGDFTPYIGVANATNGIVVNQIDDFEAFAEFADKVGRFTFESLDEGSRKKRQTSNICVTFTVSIFIKSLSILFSSSSFTVYITSPSGVVETVSSTGTIATYTKEDPEFGDYNMCSVTLFEYSISTTFDLDFFVEYHYNGSIVLEPPAGALVDVVITSSKIANISSENDIFLNLVLADGRVFSNLLLHCGSLLSGEVTIPSISFEYQLVGFDSKRIKFKTNADTKSTINIEAPHGVSINGSTTYFLGTMLELNCTAEGGSNISYAWTKNGDHEIFPAGSISNSSTFIINNVTIDDTGNFTCTASNDAGSSSFNAYIIVYVPIFNVIMDTPSTQMVSKPLTLECSVNVSRYATDIISFVWSTESRTLSVRDGVTIGYFEDNHVVYASTYTIPQLSTTDDGRVYQCEVVINTSPLISSSSNVTLDVTVPTPDISIVPFGPIDDGMVGSPQEVHCTVSTVSGVEPHLVLISWIGPGGDTITNDSRVTVHPTASFGIDFISTLEFTYLLEGDEGIYTCDVMILETIASDYIEIHNLTIPMTTGLRIIVHHTQIVGQLVTLGCSVTTMRGDTSRVEFIWSSSGTVLKRKEKLHRDFTAHYFDIYTDTYSIIPLSVNDDGRTYQCEVVFSARPPVVVTGNVTMDVIVPTPKVSISPSGPIQGAMVGSPQDIQCTVSTVSGVELSSVIISWMGPGGDTITNDSRVTISPTSGSGNNYTSSLQFMYLMEGDEGIYECNVMILETNGTDSTELQNFIVPNPTVLLTAPNTQIVGQSLTLECSVTTVRGITSRVDIIWSSNGVELKKTEGRNDYLAANNSLIYSDTYTITTLNTANEGQQIQCMVMINRLSPVIISDTLTLNVSVPQASLDILESTGGSVSGLTHILTCTATLANGVLPSLVTISWSGGSLSLSPRVIVSDQTTNGSHYTRTVIFSPLLYNDAGQYNCSVLVDGFNEAQYSGDVMIMVNAPSLTVELLPQLVNGNSGEDTIELICIASVNGNAVSATYKFIWMKDGEPFDFFDYKNVEAHSTTSSTLYINATDTNATIHNGVYQCAATLIIYEEDDFTKLSGKVQVLFTATIPPLKPINVTVTTTPYSVNISWLVKYISFDNETYSVQYGSDMPLQDSSEAVMGSTDGLVTNQVFSVNITGLTPFTTYYYIVWANNSVGNTKTSVMSFITNETAPSVAPDDFTVITTTSTSITFQWNELVDQVNGIIRWYIITCATDNSVNVIGNTTGNFTEITITGLTPYTSYTCTLHAVTVSDGPKSDPITVMTAEEAPYPPVLVEVTAVNSASVNIHWNKPSAVNGILTSYAIYYSIDNNPVIMKAVPFNGRETQEYIITQLNPYQMVNVTITATNGGGTSSHSNELSGRTSEAAPGIVKIIGVASTSNTSVNVAWIPPAPPNGIIIQYEVIYSEYNDPDSRVANSVTNNENNFIISRLDPGTPYEVVVVAFTSAGRGVETYGYVFFSEELTPLKLLENVKLERSGTSLNISWNPLSLFEARGFPVYTVTLETSSSDNRVTRQSNDGVIRVTTNESNIIVGGLDPKVEYGVTVAVGTGAGEMTTEPIVLPVEDSDDDSSNDFDFNDNMIFIALLATFAAVGIIATVIAVYTRVKSKKQKAAIRNATNGGGEGDLSVEMVQQDATIHKNVSTDRHTDDVPTVKNPMYAFGVTSLDGIEVKENIYSSIEEAQETLNSAADQSDV